MTIRKLNSISPARYIGQVCIKHPELRGERRKSTYVCVGCQRDRNKKYRQTLIGKMGHNENMKQAREYEKAAVKIKQNIAAMTKTKAIQLAREAGNSRDWPDYYQRALDQLREEGKVSPVNT